MNEHVNTLSNHNEPTSTLRVMASCLQKPKIPGVINVTKPSRRVTFPEEENELITGYLEPANPWENSDCTSPEELIALYKASCEKHGTEPLPKVVAQIEGFDFDVARNECFSLKGETLVPRQLESLEEIFKRVQFKTVDVEGTSLDDESSVALFDMIEYYESGNFLNISSNHDIGSRGWHACSRMIKRTQCLERLDAKNITLTEQHMPILSRALRIGTQLQILKLENCSLAGRPTIIMAAALRLNTSIKELYLADNDLGSSDAIQLANILRSNFTLQLLDVSNNNIQDAGVGHISDGLTEQVPPLGGGLGILVVWNNRLTRNCSKHLSRALALGRTLGVLNAGHNVLGDDCLGTMGESLRLNRSLLRLGLQSTHLSCAGAATLAGCIADHPTLQRVDLRDNDLGTAGLGALAQAMADNASVTRLDLDDAPTKTLENAEAEQYRRLVAEIRGYCERNELAARELLDTIGDEDPGTPERRVRLKSINSRKISLTCETLLRSVPAPPAPTPHLLAEPRRSGGRLRSPAPSPVPSPVSSPLPSPSRTRFSVSRVSESSSTPPSLSSSPSRFFTSPSGSRFHVSRVEQPPPVVTSPSGNNVTLGFSFDSRSSIPEICVGAGPLPCPPVLSPAVSVTVTGSSPVPCPHTVTVPCPPVLSGTSPTVPCPISSPAVSVTVRGQTVLEDTEIDFGEDPDMEVTRIMNNDTFDHSSRFKESEAVNNVDAISPTLSQKCKSIVISEDGPVPCQRHEAGNSGGQQPPLAPQRSRKISWVGPDRPQTSLEKLIGLFHPGSFFTGPPPPPNNNGESSPAPRVPNGLLPQAPKREDENSNVSKMAAEDLP